MENKYNELEKLNQLKANGTITDAEFEMQKQKILNSNIDDIKIKKKLKKKPIIITIIAILIAVLIIVAINLAPAIREKIEFNQVKNEVSKINAKELEEYITEELKNTKVNLNEKKYRERDLSKKDKYYKYETKFSKNSNGFIEANINSKLFSKNDNKILSEENVNIPCFKIESDNNGNFLNIKYIANDYMNSISIEIENSIRKVLADKCGINTNYFTRMRSQHTDICEEAMINAETFLDFDSVMYGFSEYDTFNRYYQESNLTSYIVTNDNNDGRGKLESYVYTFGINVK